LQNDPADIPKLLDEIAHGADLVCGYRAQRRDTLPKRLTSRVANTVRSRFTKDGVRDTGCTLKAMRRECVSALVPFKEYIVSSALIKAQVTLSKSVNHRSRRFGKQVRSGQSGCAQRSTCSACAGCFLGD
jgi:dolichol-phosphate mannosyltransferase